MLDLYDAGGRRLGRTVERADWSPAAGEYVKIVHVFVMDAAGRILAQRRAMTKKVWPGQWTILGGFAVSGEEPEDAVIRETREEYGLDVSACPKKLMLRLLRQGRGAIMEFWMAAADFPIEAVTIQREELDDAGYVTAQELYELYSDGERWAWEPDSYRDTVLELIKGIPEAFAAMGDAGE